MAASRRQFWNIVRRDRRRRLVARLGNAELRQGRTDSNRPHDTSRRAGAFPQRLGRSRLWTLTSAGAIAEAVLARSRADATEVIVTQRASDADPLHPRARPPERRSDRTRAIRVRAIVDGRTGIAATNALDAAALDTVAARAIEIALLAPRESDPPVLAASGSAVAPAGAYVPATAAAGPDRTGAHRRRDLRPARPTACWCIGLCDDLERRLDDRDLARARRIRSTAPMRARTSR